MTAYLGMQSLNEIGYDLSSGLSHQGSYLYMWNGNFGEPGE
jgi:hypothetical protein